MDKAELLNLYQQMVTIRLMEEKCEELYQKGKIGGFMHLYIGQEACAAGAITALTPDDKWITAYRDHAHPLGLGTSARAVMAELYGKETGVSKGKGGSMHIFDKSKNFFGGHGIVFFDECDSEDDRRYTLAHEVAHVARGDFAAALVGQLGVALHFYNPLVHWLARRLRLEQEMAADVWGARALGSRQLYLTTLAQMALRASDPPLCCAAA